MINRVRPSLRVIQNTIPILPLQPFANLATNGPASLSNGVRAGYPFLKIFPFPATQN